MPINSKRKPGKLPVVRLNLAVPFLKAAQEAGANIDELLKALHLNREAFQDETRFVPAVTMYDVVETLAEACADPFIGFRLGMMLNPFDWSPLAQAAASANSIGDFLIRFSVDAYDDASSVLFKLETEGLRSTFHEQRVLPPHRTPRHNDAFGCAYLLRILHGAVGEHWDGNQVLVNVSAPSAIPHQELGIRVATSIHAGFCISFPCAWLLLEPAISNESEAKSPVVDAVSAPVDIVAALRSVLVENIDSKEITTGHIAKLCGLSERTLARRLGEQGTSIKKERDGLRKSQAEHELGHSQLSVSDIGRRVGYADPTVFGRAFKRWTGMTPSQYRLLQSTDT